MVLSKWGLKVNLLSRCSPRYFTVCSHSTGSPSTEQDLDGLWRSATFLVKKVASDFWGLTLTLHFLKYLVRELLALFSLLITAEVLCEKSTMPYRCKMRTQENLQLSRKHKRNIMMFYRRHGTLKGFYVSWKLQNSQYVDCVAWKRKSNLSTLSKVFQALFVNVFKTTFCTKYVLNVVQMLKYG